MPVWSCYSMWWSKWRWVWWAPSHPAPLPAVIQDLLRRFSRAGISEICLWNTIALAPFPPPLKLSTVVFQLWSIGYQGKDRFSLQKSLHFLVFICSMFEQHTVKLNLPTCIIFYGHSGHFEFKEREKTTRRLLLYFQYILIFLLCF